MRLPVLQNPAPPQGEFDARALQRELGRRIAGEVRFDTGSRAAYSTDASNYRRVPTGVVVPRSLDDAIETVAVCRELGVPIVSRGGGTSLNGQCCTHGVVMDCSKYLNAILDVDPEARTATVQPGVVLDSLNERIKSEHDLAFGPDPSTHSHCTFGGMLGNNSCGVHSVIAGRTSDNVIEMDVLTSDGVRLTVGAAEGRAFEERMDVAGRVGEIYRRLGALRDTHAQQIRRVYPDIPRRVSGYNLPDLLDPGCNIARALIGSEGTCVTILSAKVRLIEWPRSRVLLVLGYPSIFEAADHVPEIMESELMGLEGLDDRLVQFMKLRGLHPDDVKLLPGGSAWLLVEFGGATRDEAEAPAQQLMERLKAGGNPPHMELLDDPAREQKIWEVRESALGSTAFVPGMHDTWPGWEDAAVPPERAGDYLRKFRKLLTDFGYDCSLYGHFGQGCIHCRINFDLVTPEGVAKFHEFVHRSADLVLEHGGSLSAEHGDGLAKSALLPKMYGRKLMDAFGEFKSIWDPDGIMNPGKIVGAPSITDDLRLGAGYHPKRLATGFSYPQGADQMFERSSIRCVGVGECRRREDAFMCPSYLATQEELDSTRGRARLLFEMTRGDFITQTWRSQAVRESLDLCLACKGCKKECPVGVDMATYKAEFLHHHFKHRLRPREFYAMGFIGLWADVASVAPWLANWAGSASGVSRLTKWIAGVDGGRDMPRFAPQTFRAWFADRDMGQAGPLGSVLLIPDAFNDHFFPDTLRAATYALERLGYRVELPDWKYPAIRPLVHYGFLTRARRQLGRLLQRLDVEASKSTPIVALEPSTLAVLRDEASGLFPDSPVASRVSQTSKLFSEFLAERHADELPHVGGRCVFHAHCHQKAVLDADAARTVLGRMGLEVCEPETGCCGMAGSFGFERSHAELSRKIGEMNLLPAVREAGAGDPIVIEGFSCREQIAQGTGRIPVHLAELVASAMGSHEMSPGRVAGGAE